MSCFTHTHIYSLLLDTLHKHANRSVQSEPCAATVFLIINKGSGRQWILRNHELESLNLVHAAQSKRLQLRGSSVARDVIGNAFATENR